jgi:hypothetical protein
MKHLNIHSLLYSVRVIEACVLTVLEAKGKKKHMGEKCIGQYEMGSYRNSVQFNLFYSRNPCLVIQPPYIEQVSNKIVM